MSAAKEIKQVNQSLLDEVVSIKVGNGRGCQYKGRQWTRLSV